MDEPFQPIPSDIVERCIPEETKNSPASLCWVTMQRTHKHPFHFNSKAGFCLSSPANGASASSLTASVLHTCIDQLLPALVGGVLYLRDPHSACGQAELDAFLQAPESLYVSESNLKMRHRVPMNGNHVSLEVEADVLARPTLLFVNDASQFPMSLTFFNPDSRLGQTDPVATGSLLLLWSPKRKEGAVPRAAAYRCACRAPR